MAETTIEWTATRQPDGTYAPGYTFNPWVGCAKVSPGCANCYAAVDTTARVSRSRGVELWGKDAARQVKAESGWSDPIRWDRKAAKAGERRRVFCASMSDVFEDRPDLVAPRERLFRLICQTPHLDWMVLTKRPENALRLMVQAGLYASENPSLPCPQPNLWIGTSVEDQQRADERIPHLLSIPAAVRFLSMEPLLGPVDLRRGIYSMPGGNVPGPPTVRYVDRGTTLNGIHLVIVGGESGRKARPMNPDWVRSIRDQCNAAGVAFFFKQWGDWLPNDHMEVDERIFFHSQGRAWHRWDEATSFGSYRVGKKVAGRVLDGRTWDEMPEAAHAQS